MTARALVWAVVVSVLAVGGYVWMLSEKKPLTDDPKPAAAKTEKADAKPDAMADAKIDAKADPKANAKAGKKADAKADAKAAAPK